MPLLLELFSGTGSIGRAFRQKGWDVFAVDLNPTAEADLHIDILDLTPAMLPPQIDCIWASPPCTHDSRARTKAKTPRDLIGSDKLVQQVLDLVAHYGVPYFIENPHSGLLKDREVVQGIPMQVVDYCRYGAAYRKRTAIWTNTAWQPARPLCNTTVQAAACGDTRPGPSKEGGTTGVDAARTSCTASRRSCAWSLLSLWTPNQGEHPGNLGHTWGVAA